MTAQYESAALPTTLPDPPEAVPPPAAPAPHPALVRAVLVTRGSEHLRRCLEAVKAQSYRYMDVLVVDAGATDDPAPLVREVLPHARVAKRSARGFAEAANIVLRDPDPPVFYWFLHDDVAPQVDALGALVEGARAMQAAVVGGKVVQWEEPEHLLEVGNSVDRFGYPYWGIDRGELDQSQYDLKREVFFVGSASLLVAAGLFRAIGGFDPQFRSHVDDMDLCWRAHIVGARVAYTPAAVTEHAEAPTDRFGADGDIAHWRRRAYRLRAVMKNYGFFRALLVLFEYLFFAPVEALVLRLLGQKGEVVGVVRAAGWNLFHLPTTLRLRRRVQRRRRTRDEEIARFQVGGFLRLRTYVEHALGQREGSRFSAVGLAVRSSFARSRRLFKRPLFLFSFALVVALLVAVRGFFLSEFPTYNEFLPVQRGVSDVMYGYFADNPAIGLAGAYAQSPAVLVQVITQVLALGRDALAAKLLVLGCLPVGVFGVARSLRPLARSGWGPAVGAALYALNPVPFALYERGELTALVAYAALPWIIGRLRRLTDYARPWHDRVADVGVLALWVALGGAFAPEVLFLAAATVAIFTVMLPLTWDTLGTLRVLLLGAAGVGLGALLLAPWLGNFLAARGGLEAYMRGAGTGGVGTAPLDVVQFAYGGRGGPPFGALYAAAGILAVLVARGPRLRHAIRLWAVGAFAAAALVAIGRGDVQAATEVVDLLWITWAAALAGLGGLVLCAFGEDVRRARFGLRQVAASGGVILALGAGIPFLAGLGDGRLGVPDRSYASEFAWMGPRAEEEGPFRVLWLGSAETLPGRSRPFSGGLSYTVTGPVSPTVASLWAPPPAEGEAQLERVLAAVSGGDLIRAGHSLAAFGIRYVAFPDVDVDSVEEDRPPLLRAFGQQLDFGQVDDSDVFLLENDDWLPVAAAVASAYTPELAGDPASAAFFTVEWETGADYSLAVPLGYDVGGRDPLRLNAGDLVVLSRPYDVNWTISAGRGEAAQVLLARGFGWANAFLFPDGADTPLRIEYGATPRDAQVTAQLAGIGALLLVLAIVKARRPGGAGV